MCASCKVSDSHNRPGPRRPGPRRPGPRRPGPRRPGSKNAVLGTSFFRRQGAGGRSAAGWSSIPIPSYTKTQNSPYFTRYTFFLLADPRSATIKEKRGSDEERTRSYNSTT